MNDILQTAEYNILTCVVLYLLQLDQTSKQGAGNCINFNYWFTLVLAGGFHATGSGEGIINDVCFTMDVSHFHIWPFSGGAVGDVAMH